MHRRFLGLLVALVLVLTAFPALAAVDNVVMVVDNVMATGPYRGTSTTNPTNSLATLGYNPADDSIYAAAFGAGAEIRKITNLDGAQTSEIYVSETELQLFYRDGDPNRSVTTPTVSGMVLNPKQLGDFAPYTMAVVVDISTTREPGGSTKPVDPAATKRFYQYNLQQVQPGQDGRNVMTTLTTLADFQAAASTTSTTANVGRQFAWSGDGQRIYLTATTSDTIGLYKLDPLNGDIVRLTNEGDNSTELAVTSSGGVDSIYLRGGGSTGNAGGIDKFTYDGATLGARSVFISAAALRTFYDGPTSGTFAPEVSAMTTDDAGNIYFNNSESTSGRRGIYRVDPQGRIVKLASYAERSSVFSPKTPNSNTLRMQPRSYDHPTAGEITQLLYVESTPVNVVAGVNVFEIGDFDRDGGVDAADLALFNAALTTRGTVTTDADQFKFDLNGNVAVDWKDVKILQQFTTIYDGDLNFDGLVDFTDLDTMNVNYYTNAGQTAETWRDGDIASVDPTYAVGAADANLVNAVDLGVFANTWLNVLGQTITVAELTSRNYAGVFLDDAMTAFGLSATLVGDYNGDQVVDAADYTVWRDTLGATGSNLAADGNGDLVIDDLDFGIWKDHFGDAAGSGSLAGAAVPEPASWLLVLSVAGLGLTRRSSGRGENRS